MRTVFYLDILHPGGGGTRVEKQVDLPFTPFIGMEIEQAAWHEGRAIKNVLLNIDEDYFYVYLGQERPSSKEEVDSTVKMYESHGWKSNTKRIDGLLTRVR